MNLKILILTQLGCLFLMIFLNHPPADAAVKGKTRPLASQGKLIFKDDFKTPGVYTKEFQPVESDWKVKAAHAGWKSTGRGVESYWEAGHMPVLVYQGNFGDAVIEVDFRFFPEDGKWAACRVSATNPELNPRAYAASVWANATGNARAKGMVLEHDEWKPGVITAVDSSAAVFKPGRWYRLRVELVADQVRAVSGKYSVCGTHEKFGIPKNSLYLGSGTCRHEFRRLRIYESKTRKSIIRRT